MTLKVSLQVCVVGLLILVEDSFDPVAVLRQDGSEAHMQHLARIKLVEYGTQRCRLSEPPQVLLRRA
jgi:hypothetical protein